MGILQAEKSVNTGQSGKNGNQSHTRSRYHANVAQKSNSKRTILWRHYTRRMKTGPFLPHKCTNCTKTTLELYSIRAIEREMINMCLICTIQEFELILIMDDIGSEDMPQDPVLDVKEKV